MAEQGLTNTVRISAMSFAEVIVEVFVVDWSKKKHTTNKNQTKPNQTKTKQNKKHTKE
jgi:hypothetical protein